MTKTTYNFRKSENKERAVYKLLMYPREGSGIRGSYTNGKGNSVIVFYGYYNKTDHGLRMLQRLISRYKNKIYLAIIYAKPGLNPCQSGFSEIVEKYTT